MLDLVELAKCPQQMEKFLWLTTDDRGPDIGALTPFTIPTSARNQQKISCMSEVMFEQKLCDQGGTAYTWPLVAGRNITTTETCMNIVLFPAFIIYDIFIEDLDTVYILEIIMVSPHRNIPSF